MGRWNEDTMIDLDHFSDSKLSCWQAAVAHIAATSQANTAQLTNAPRDRNAPLVKAATQAAAIHAGSDQPKPPSVLGSIGDCAQIGLAIGMAEVSGQTEKAKELLNAFDQYGQCDVRWKECIDQFKTYYDSARNNKAYTPWANLSDFVLDLPSKCRVGIIGDWGTGQDRAFALLRNLAKHEPDIVIHLGDIYYACTKPEADIFLRQINAAFANKKPRIFTLCGNHDMYSGGVSYQALLKEIGQPASFFCLRNASWQILAADTGFNDFDPNSQGSIATWIQDHDGGDAYSEWAWHQDKLASAGSRKTIFMTHHQPFTRNSPIEHAPTNEKLLGQIRPHLDEVTLWLWGHEHNQVLYGPWQGVERGRCLGASGVPTPASSNAYSLAPGFKGWTSPPLLVDPKTRLKEDQRLGLYNLGYGLIDIDGMNASAVYLEFNSTKNISSIAYQESF